MRIKSKAIILHSTKYSETSLVVKAYTEDSGLMSLIVGGVRGGGKMRFPAGLFQPFSLVELVASGKPGTAMPRITDIQLSPAFQNIPNNLLKGSILMFLSEVVSRCIKEEEPSPSLFQFLYQAAQILDLYEGNCNRFHIHFLVKLTGHTGFYPNGSFSSQSPYFDLREGSFTSQAPLHNQFTSAEVSKALSDFMHTTFEEHHRVEVEPAVSKALLNALVAYFELHMTHGREIQSHKILAEVLS